MHSGYEVIKLAEDVCGVSRRIIWGRSRRKRAIVARQVVMVVLTERLGFTHYDAAETLNRVPSNVTKSLPAAKFRIANEFAYKRAYQAIIKGLGVEDPLEQLQAITEDKEVIA